MSESGGGRTRRRATPAKPAALVSVIPAGPGFVAVSELGTWPVIAWQIVPTVNGRAGPLAMAPDGAGVPAWELPGFSGVTREVIPPPAPPAFEQVRVLPVCDREHYSCQRVHYEDAPRRSLVQHVLEWWAER